MAKKRRFLAKEDEEFAETLRTGCSIYDELKATPLKNKEYTFLNFLMYYFVKQAVREGKNIFDAVEKIGSPLSEELRATEVDMLLMTRETVYMPSYLSFLEKFLLLCYKFRICYYDAYGPERTIDVYAEIDEPFVEKAQKEIDEFNENPVKKKHLVDSFKSTED